MEALMLAASDVAAQLEGRPFKTLEENLKAAMRLTKDHWMVTGEDDRFKAAIGAVLINATPDEKERIGEAMAPLKALGAAMSGVPVDFAAMLEGLPEDLLPLKKLWDEVKDAKE